MRTDHLDRYADLKRLRLCPRCKGDCDRPDGVYCSRCTKSNSSPERQAEARERWRQESLALGLCCMCGARERDTKADGRLAQMCQPCGRARADRQIARYRQRRPVVEKVCHCSRCGQAGHNARGCRSGQADTVAGPTIDEYATARREWT